MVVAWYVVGVSLDNEQEENLATIINPINGNPEASTTLESIFSEAEATKEGRGNILKSLWEKEKERAVFFKDPKNNSKLYI